MFELKSLNREERKGIAKNAKRNLMNAIANLAYYAEMRITLSLDPEVIKAAREVAAERRTTLSALVSSHLEQVVADYRREERKLKDLELLKKTRSRHR